jgi:hypothetical protein
MSGNDAKHRDDVIDFDCLVQLAPFFPFFWAGNYVLRGATRVPLEHHLFLPLYWDVS